MLFNTARICGHVAPRRDALTAFGKTVKVVARHRLWQKEPDYCPRCLEKMAIQCGACSRPIFPGDPVSVLILRKDKLPTASQVLEIMNPNEVEVLCCLNDDCLGDVPGGFAGHWVAPGKLKQ